MTEPPASLDELNARTMANMKTTGYGFDVTQHFPCPFCAAPDWYVVKLLDFAQDSPSTACEYCGRSARFIYTSTGGGPMAGGSSGMELVQTGGPDPPEWLPAPRREAA